MLHLIIIKSLSLNYSLAVLESGTSQHRCNSDLQTNEVEVNVNLNSLFTCESGGENGKARLPFVLLQWQKLVK